MRTKSAAMGEAAHGACHTSPPDSWTFSFRVDAWSPDADVPYRIAYALKTAPGEEAVHYYEGTVRADVDSG